MLKGTQDTFNASSMLTNLGSDFAPSDVIPSSFQLFASSEPIQIQLHIHRSVPIESITYPASAYQWLVEVLDGLIDFRNRHGHYGAINLTEDEYEWFDNVLEELIYSVGDNENHLLAPLMDFVIHLISSYEDVYVPKLTEQSLNLAERETSGTGNEKRNSSEKSNDMNDDELAAHAFFSIGYLLWQGNKKERSLSAYRMATALKPNSWETFYNLGTAKGKIGQSEKAIVDFDVAIKLNSNSAKSYLNRGAAKGSCGQYKEAIVDFDKVIELEPNNVDAHNNRGRAKCHLGKYQEAIADFDKVIEFEHNSAEVYYLRALAKTLLGKHDIAIPDYDKVIKLKPDCVEAYNYRGILKQELRMYKDALADFNNAISINPDFPQVYNSRANLRGVLGQFDDAIADSIKAIRLKPDYAEAYANRGMAKIELNRINDAKSDFQTALELAEQQGQEDLKTFIEEQIRELSNLTTQDREN